MNCKIELKILLILFFFSGCSKNEPKNERDIIPIKKTSKSVKNQNSKTVNQNYQNLKSQENGETIFNYIKNNIVTSESHIIDLGTVEFIKPIKRTNNEYTVKTNLSNGDLLEVSITTAKFIKENHEIVFLDYGPVNTIDGQQAFYGDSIPIYPLNEFNTFAFRLNGQALNIQKEIYSNLYDAHLDKDKWIWMFGFNIYFDPKNELIHLLFGGGNVSGTYMAKMVFNKTQCVAKYILPYEILSEFGCFSPVFPGF